MSCAVADPDLGVPLLQNGAPRSREFEGRTHTARRCAECGHVFFTPPSVDVLARYYQTTYPEESTSWYNVEADYAAAKVASRARRVIDIGRQFGFNESHAFHEAGCAFGGTVHELRKLGVHATGTDLNANAIAQGSARGNTYISAEADTEYLKRSVVAPNVVYGFHVLEHMPDPAGWLRQLAACLAEEAIVVLFVPNAMALYPTAYGFDRYSWFGYPFHLTMFSPHSARCLASACGYDVLDVATAPSDLEPDATRRALGEAIDTPLTALFRRHMITEALMDEELVIVLARSRSPIATKYSDRSVHAEYRCQDSKDFESEIRTIGETSPLSTPDGMSSPAGNELTDQVANLVRVSEDLIGSLKRWPKQHQDDDLARTRLALRAIESSTFWRMTALPRRLAERLKSRAARLSR